LFIPGGRAYDWGAHFIDWLLNLLPFKVESVYGFYQKRLWFDVTNEDHGQIILRLEGGRYADSQVSEMSAVDKPKWRILGTKGALVLNKNEDKIDVVAFIRDFREEMRIPFPANNYISYYINVADHLLTGEHLEVTPESARRVIAVLELAEKSAKSGKAESFLPMSKK